MKIYKKTYSIFSVMFGFEDGIKGLMIAGNEYVQPFVFTGFWSFLKLHNKKQVIFNFITSIWNAYSEWF